jgi:hypothetical protein
VDQLTLALENNAEIILTVPKVASKLDADVNKVLAWIKAGSSPNAYKMNPHLKKSRWRIPKGGLGAFIEQRRKQRGHCYTVK